MHTFQFIKNAWSQRGYATLLALLLAMTVWGQEITVSGVILDETDAPLIGATVSVTNAYATRSLASGWIYYNESLTKSGGTASLSASLTRNGYGTVPVALSLTCDKNGNIS